LLGAALGALAASVLAAPAVAGKAENSVRFAAYTTLDSADAYFTNSRLAVIIADSVWDTLIFRNPETGAFEGNLATAWRWIDDTTLELDLRRGVRFHNGAVFEADDVVYTLNFVKDPQNKAIKRSDLRWVDHIEKLDAYKIRIVATQPFPAAIATLANPAAAIYPHEYYAQVGPKGMSEKPVGSGPYRVVEHARGKHILLERNPDYSGTGPKSRPKVDRIDIRFIPDPQTRVAEVVAGGTDLIMYVARDQAEQLRDLPTLQIVSGDTIRYSYLALNTQPTTPAPALLDVRVRQAIAHAIDRDAIVKHLVGNGARVLNAECHPAQFGCEDANVPRHDYDPAKARRLLAEAGYAKGFAIDLYAASRDRNPTEAIIGYLGAVGIQARLRTVETTVASDLLRRGRAALAHLSWGSSSIMDASASVSNFHEFSADDVNRDPEVRDLLVRGDTAMDPQARKDAYAKALALIAERVYAVPLYSVPVYYVADKDLVFTPFADEVPRFWEMRWR